MDEKSEQKLKQLGGKFRKLRTIKNMSQTDLACLIDKDQPSINRLEKGNINPSYLYLLQVCEGLDITLPELLLCLDS